MKKIVYTLCICFSSLLALTGCNDWVEGNVKSNLRTVHASFDNEKTRVGIEQATDSRDMITKWQENDKIHVFVSKGNNIVDLGSVPVHDISTDGKSCTFQYALPDDFDEFDEGYSLTCFTDNCLPKIKDGDIYYNATLNRMPISQFKAPLMFDAYVKEENTFGAFRHYGTYEIMHITNNTEKAISFQLSDFYVTPWWYKKGGLSIRLWDNSYVTDLSYEEKPLSPAITIPAHGTDMVVSWYIPNGKAIENAQIVANIDGQYVYSSNTISSNVTLCTGIAYHLYATWDGEELRYNNVSETEQLQLSTSTLTLTTGSQGMVDITSGSGSYDAASNAKNVATVTVEGSKVIIKGVNSGSATITVKDNQTQERAKIEVTVADAPQSYLTCPDDHHPHLIDLGLPSGTRWACCNVGADKPEIYGGYFAWGETEEKDEYDWSTYIHCDGSEETCHDLGFDISGTQYDVAHVKWGSGWVMPSHDQFDELVDNCTSGWTTLNGVDGYIFTGSNDGTLFLPLAGYHIWGSLYDTETNGSYWSSTLDDNDNYPYRSYAWYLSFIHIGSDVGVHTYTGMLKFGSSVRPVWRP